MDEISFKTWLTLLKVQKRPPVRVLLTAHKGTTYWPGRYKILGFLRVARKGTTQARNSNTFSTLMGHLQDTGVGQ